MATTRMISLTLILFLGVLGGTAGASETKITWLGHAAFQIVTPKGKVLMIDPWLKNPVANPPNKNNNKDKEKNDPVAKVEKLDYILISHGHFDHIGDSVELAKKTKARLVTNFELGFNMKKILGYPPDQMGFDTLLNIGGEISIADGEVMVSLTPAVHSSGMTNPNAGRNQPDIIYGGSPAGIILKINEGPTIYHTGDTAYFSDMKLIGETYAPDLALINIGGHFGMEPSMAVKAAVAVKAKIVIPHHFATFPVLTQSAEGFGEMIKKKEIEFVELKPGGSISFVGNKQMK